MADKTIKVSEETRDRVNAVASKMGVKAGMIIALLLDKNDKHDFFDPGWEVKLAEEKFNQLLQDHDLNFRKTIEIANYKAVLKAKHFSFTEYVKTLGPNEKKDFLENILGNPKDGTFLDRLSNYTMFLVNGMKKLTEPDETGKPKIVGIKSELIIGCERGWHIVGGYCECSQWRTCPIRSAEIVDWLAVHGTLREQDEYLRQPFQPKLLP